MLDFSLVEYIESLVYCQKYAKLRVMTNRKDLLQLSFYKLSPFFGSDGDTRYKIEKEDDHFKLTTWPGPYSFDNTDESLMHYETFEFTDDGLQQIVDYLNRKGEESS